jgi:flagellar assembly protein FliH
VIKGTSVVNQGRKEIITEYIPKMQKEITEGVYAKDKIEEVYTKDVVASYEALSNSILEQAKAKRDEILFQVYNEAEKIRSEAYNKAYEIGYAEGKDKGYSEAYEEGYKKNIKKVQDERESLIKEAQNTSTKIIESAKAEYLRYLDEKKDQIVKTVKDIVEAVFKREIKDVDSLNYMVLDVLDLAKGAKSLIVRCNEIYGKELKSTIDVWKSREIFKGEVFVILDETMPEGNLIIEKDNGKILINTDKALEKIEEILFSD